MLDLVLFLVCVFLLQKTLFSSPSPPAPPNPSQDESIVHEYADRYVSSLNKGIEKEIGVAADELFAFMFITGITRFRHKGKTFVIRKQLLVSPAASNSK